MKYVWGYQTEIERTTAAAGTILFQLEPAAQQIVEIYLMVISNNTTARRVRFYQDSPSSHFIGYYDETIETVRFPSKCFRGSFKWVEPDKIILAADDLFLIEMFSVAQTEELHITIRGLLNSYALPTVVGAGLGNTVNLETSKIIGVIE